MKTEAYIESPQPTLHAVYRVGNEVVNVHNWCGKCAQQAAQENGWPTSGRKRIKDGRNTTVEIIWDNRPVDYCEECNPFTDHI